MQEEGVGQRHPIHCGGNLIPAGSGGRCYLSVTPTATPYHHHHCGVCNSASQPPPLLLLLHLLLLHGDLLILGQWSWRELIVLCSRSFQSSALWPHRRRPWPSFVWLLGGSLPSGGVALAWFSSGWHLLDLHELPVTAIHGRVATTEHATRCFHDSAGMATRAIHLVGGAALALVSTAKRRPSFH